MKKLITTAIAILFVMTGCGGNKQAGDDLITVDVTASYPKKELILQDFMNVEYIPLETSDEFITAAYVQAIGKNVIIVRNINQADGGSIFIYDKKGKALRKINRRGAGNEEYPNIFGLIAFDEENNEIFVNCAMLSKILVYDLDGNYKRSLKYVEGREESGRFKSSIYYNPIRIFDRDNLIIQDQSSGRNYFDYSLSEADLSPRNIFLIISKQDGSITKEIQIPFEKKVFQGVFPSVQGGRVGLVRNYGLIPYQGKWMLTEPSSDTIYTYSTDHSIIPFIIRTPSVQSVESDGFLFPGVITDRYSFMQIVKKEIDETYDPQSRLRKVEIVYDRQEKNTYEYTLYNNDFTTKRLIKNITDDILTLTVINDNEVAFIEKIEAAELVEAYENDQLRGRLKEIAANLDEESNPVIMIAKHKK